VEQSAMACHEERLPLAESSGSQYQVSRKASSGVLPEVQSKNYDTRTKTDTNKRMIWVAAFIGTLSFFGGYSFP
jgi:hypothetical protein